MTRISPTAHYTGQIWIRNGLADPALGTHLGRVLYRLVQPVMKLLSPTLEGLTLEAYLLDRHRAIDKLLTQAIEEEGVLQVVEIAAGLSPRGYRFARKYCEAGLLYVEGDLPEMAARKRRTLWSANLQPPNHRVVDLDILCESGPENLEQMLERELDPQLPTVFIAEGILSYFDGETMRDLWPRFAAILSSYPSGSALVANMELAEEADRWPAIRAFKVLLAAFAAAPVQLHFTDVEGARRQLGKVGYERVTLHLPSELLGPRPTPEIVRILVARTA